MGVRASPPVDARETGRARAGRAVRPRRRAEAGGAGSGAPPRRGLPAAALGARLLDAVVMLSLSLASSTPSEARWIEADDRTRLPGGTPTARTRYSMQDLLVEVEAEVVGRGGLAGAVTATPRVEVRRHEHELGRQAEHDLERRRGLRRDVVLDRRGRRGTPRRPEDALLDVLQVLVRSSRSGWRGGPPRRPRPPARDCSRRHVTSADDGALRVLEAVRDPVVGRRLARRDGPEVEVLRRRRRGTRRGSRGPRSPWRGRRPCS